MVQIAAPPSLIRSKLYPPRLVSNHVTRDRLLDQLTTESHRSLTLVCAPAGSGKSTLLSEWLASVRAPHGWISLDEHDNERDVFLEYVLAAAQSAFPTVTYATRDLLETRIPPPLAMIARSLMNDLDQHEDDFTLVLDDYHLITNTQIHELLIQVLQHPPAGLHLVIATRSEPSWPLASLRARGKMTELRFSDLRFTAAESVVLLQNALGDAVHEDVLADLHNESEGWAAGLHLMTLVLHGQETDQPRSSRTPLPNKDIGEYLLAEVLSRQASVDQDRLLQMSILERFSASLCEAVVRGIEDQGAVYGVSEAWGKEFLARLNQANLFLIPLDSRHEFYRFHHLFQQFLATRLVERSSTDEIAGLHRRASEWFAEHGFIEDALDHVLAAGDPTAAAQLVARHRHALYNNEQFARLARWLRLLPADVKDQTPELLLAEARIATMNWRFTEAAVILARAEDQLIKRGREHPGADALKGELLVLRGVLELWEGDAERLLASTRYALEVLPPDASHLRGMAHIGIAAGHCLLGEAHYAWEYLDEQVASHSPRLPVYAWLLETQGFLNWIEGDLTNLHDVARRLIRVSEDLELPEHEVIGHYFLGVVHYARNELEAAEQHLKRAVAARFSMRLLWWCQAAGVLGLTHLALGQSEQARETLEDAHAFLLEQHAVRILPNMGAFQAEANRLQHRLVEASRWAAGVEPLPLTWGNIVVEPRLVQIRVFLSRTRVTDWEQAEQLLAELRAFCDRVPNRRLLMEVEVLEALLHEVQGHRERALETLRRVVLTAETDGWVRLFLDVGPKMEGLLVQLAVQGIAPNYIEHILAAFRQDPALPAAPPLNGQAKLQLIEPLSERELDVLTLLAQRFSNKEIATRLFIAPATVKHHTINIYRKLDANDRRQAVARADTLGLLTMTG